MRLLVILAVLSVGCGAATPVVQYKGIPEAQYVEQKKLPDSPASEPIAKKDNWVKSLPASVCTDEKGVERKTDHGIVMSAQKAARAKRWQDAYNNIRSLYELDRQIFGQHRIIYDERTKQANEEIVRLSPSWWDENKGTFGWGAGFVAGAAATIAIVYAVDEVK
jgi:hypothetical protein